MATVDENGFPYLDSPEWSIDDQLDIAKTRFMTALAAVPYLCRYIDHPHDLAAVVDDLVRHIARDIKPGARMTHEQLFQKYVARVESRAGSRASDAELTRVWTEHARQLTQRWGNTLEGWRG